MRLLLLTLLLTLVLTAKEKVALVIGNKNYTNQTGLNNPINDAKLIRDTFSGMGYEVLEAYNLNLNDLDDKLDAFIKKAHSAKIAVIYYAGHGMGVNGKNYLIPIGTSNLSVSRLDKRLTSVNELKEAVSYASGFGVVMFDACRNSLFKEKIRGLSARGGRALVRPTVSRANVLVSFSTSPNTIANDDVRNGKHSPYALALSEKLKANKNSDIRQVMGSIRDRVYALTSYKENPQETVEENKLGGKQYCLSGICKQGESEETRRLREQIALLKRQQEQNRVVVVDKPIETIHYAGENAASEAEVTTSNDIVKIGKRMYQNQPFTKRYTWKEAKGYCQDLTLGGYSGWRLPTRAELNKISNIKMYRKYDSGWSNWFDKNKHKRLKGSKGRERFVRKEFLENMQEGSYFWTSEERDSSYAGGVYFYLGNDNWGFKTNPNYALCVR